MRTAISNALCLAGCGLFLYGVALVYVPAAYAVAGVITVVVAVNLSRGK